jgi:hypothetical protein
MSELVDALKTLGRPDICGLCKRGGRACHDHFKLAVEAAIPVAEAQEVRLAELEATHEQLLRDATAVEESRDSLAGQLLAKEAENTRLQEENERLRECGPCGNVGGLMQPYALCERHGKEAFRKAEAMERVVEAAEGPAATCMVALSQGYPRCAERFGDTEDARRRRWCGNCLLRSALDDLGGRE